LLWQIYKDPCDEPHEIKHASMTNDAKAATPNRRQLLALGAAAFGTAVLTSACTTAPTADTAIQWRLRTSWRSDMPGFAAAAERLAARINQLCGGRLKVSVLPAASSVQAFSVFDDVSAGRAEMAHTSAQFWAGKSLAAPFFSSVPFGMTSDETTSWLLAGEGLALWRELYGHFGLVPFPVGNTGAQLAGWFKREVKSLRTLRKLKMRLTGLGAQVWQRIGGTVIAMDGADLVAALNADTLDAAEWLGPWNDLQLGLHMAAGFYYYPGWQKPGATMECIVNQNALNQLAPELQAAIESACLACHAEETALMNARNQQALLTLVSVHKIDVRRLPAEVIAALLHAAEAVRAELAAQDTFARRVFDSAMAFREQARQWQQVGEHAFVAARG
jgi:TRAP-type mannitol/chloroaromatic compound transport system substrate-binding protein